MFLWADRELGIGGVGKDLIFLVFMRITDSAPNQDAAEVSTRFWKNQHFPSTQVNQSGYENPSDDFCASQEGPVPVPPFPVLLLVLPGLLLCSKKIQRGKKRDWLSQAGSRTAQTKPEKNREK